ncbi:branched-chain amino acid aminotransferase II [Periconia macrospinosa]|uniref:Branched-chain amino acid aminotransferase II n=1 Tax=Periconia macrospinosa TaxID=97972 RepID=A0A2V1DAL0_9PLEO|nr:branched-chain amino acid aminotransferase II [Periconia macrospinosa]
MSFSESNGNRISHSGIRSTVKGHVESRFSSTTGQWTEPCFVTGSLLTLDGMSPGLNYGQQIFEGLKARRNRKGGITIFRPKDHATRIKRSAELMAMPEVPEELFLTSVHLAVSGNSQHLSHHDANAALYIRPIEFASSARLLIEPSDEFMFCVYVQQIIGPAIPSKGKALISDDFDRAATRGVGAAKAGGNYAPAMRWTAKAKRQGYDFLLHLDSQSQSEIEEFSWSGFVGVRRDGDKVTVIHSSSNAIIASITVDSIVRLATSLGWRTEKRPIKYDELSTFTEVFAAGTAIGLTPISSIHRPSTNETYHFDADGLCYHKLQDSLLGIQKGKIEDAFGWCVQSEPDTTDQLDHRAQEFGVRQEIGVK